MSQLYTTREGDMVDWICWRHYGVQSGAVEAVLEANRGLAEYGDALPAGLEITLPEIALPVVSTDRMVRLWD